MRLPLPFARAQKATELVNAATQVPIRLFRDLISFRRGSDDGTGGPRVPQFHLSLFRFFFHPHPPKLSNELEGFHRWPVIALHSRNFSTL